MDEVILKASIRRPRLSSCWLQSRKSRSTWPVKDYISQLTWPYSLSILHWKRSCHVWHSHTTEIAVHIEQASSGRIFSTRQHNGLPLEHASDFQREGWATRKREPSRNIWRARYDQTPRSDASNLRWKHRLLRPRQVDQRLRRHQRLHLATPWQQSRMDFSTTWECLGQLRFDHVGVGVRTGWSGCTCTR